MGTTQKAEKQLASHLPHRYHSSKDFCPCHSFESFFQRSLTQVILFFVNHNRVALFASIALTFLTPESEHPFSTSTQCTEDASIVLSKTP